MGRSFVRECFGNQTYSYVMRATIGKKAGGQRKSVETLLLYHCSAFLCTRIAVLSASVSCAVLGLSTCPLRLQV